MVLYIFCCIFGHDTSFAFWQKDLTYEGESVYNYLQVYEDEESVVLSTNVLFGVQSVYKTGRRLTGLYYDYAMAAPYMAGIYESENVDMDVDGINKNNIEIKEGVDDKNLTYLYLVWVQALMRHSAEDTLEI